MSEFTNKDNTEKDATYEDCVVHGIGNLATDACQDRERQRFLNANGDFKEAYYHVYVGNNRRETDEERQERIDRSYWGK